MAEKGDTTTSTSVGELSSSGKEVPKAVIKNVDMSEEMQQETVDIASAALEKYNIEKDIAAQIKKEFDRRHGPTWHVVVGKNFGSYVTHGEYAFVRHQWAAELGAGMVGEGAGIPVLLPMLWPPRKFGAHMLTPAHETHANTC